MGPATVWPEEGPLRARCLRPGLGHAPPEFDLPCGVYAYYRARMPWPTSVNGAIRAWGRIVRHERGFRCEYAQIVALTEPEAPRPCIGERIEGNDLRAIADRYGVPILPRPELMSYAGWQGEVAGPGDVIT